MKVIEKEELPEWSTINYFTYPSLLTEQEVTTNTFYSQSEPEDEYNFDHIPNELCLEEQRIGRQRPHG